MSEQLRDSPVRRLGPLDVALVCATAAAAVFATIAGVTTATVVVAFALLAVDLVVIVILRPAAARDGPRAGRDDLTDELTGLPNRDAFLRDAATAAAGNGGGTPPSRVLLLVELDGMQRYTQAFGQFAGDALVAHLAARLSRSCASRGTAYRIGGARFGALVDVGPEGADALVETMSTAIGDRGEGFEIRAICGAAEVSREAGSVAGAIDLADRRLADRREAAGEVPSASMRQIMLRRLRAKREVESLPGYTMGGLAREVAGHLGLGAVQSARTVLAAELHDVGKAAIPREILEKPGPLSRQEWLFVHRSPAVGERIVSVTVPEAEVAEVVRAAGEHYDGSGHPDGLSGAQISLEGRIVAVLAGLEALLSERTYRHARSRRVALDELQAGSGHEYDPAVIAVVCELLQQPGLQAAVG